MSDFKLSLLKNPCMQHAVPWPFVATQTKDKKWVWLNYLASLNSLLKYLAESQGPEPTL
jgi:hypothetical protein